LHDDDIAVTSLKPSFAAARRRSHMDMLVLNVQLLDITDGDVNQLI